MIYSNDSKLIYVSSTEGSDITGAPVNINENPKPFRTIKKASTFLRDGFPDALLLKCGDSFEETISLKNGRSNDERLVCSAYGVGPKPVIIISDKPTNDILKFGNVTRLPSKNILVDGIDFYQRHLDPSSDTFNPYGIRNYISTVLKNPASLENIIIQNCRFRYIQVNLQRQIEDTPGYINNFSIDHNQFLDAYDDSNHAQGIFTRFFPISITNNFFDHNGWNESTPSGTGAPTIFNHNLYISECVDTKVIGNVFCRPSSINIKVSNSIIGFVSKNIVIDNNLILDGEIGISVGGNVAGDEIHNNPIITNNVFIHLGTSICTNREAAQGIRAWGWKDGKIYNNLMICPDQLITNQQFITIPTNLRGVKISKNIVLNLKNGTATKPNNSYGVISVLGDNNLIEINDNIFHCLIGYTIVCKNSTGINIHDNTYMLPCDPTNQPIFRINNVEQNLQQFSNSINESPTVTAPQLPTFTVAEFINIIRDNFDDLRYSASFLNDNFRKSINMKKASTFVEANQPNQNNTTLL